MQICILYCFFTDAKINQFCEIYVHIRKQKAVLSSQTARLNNSQKMKLAENNGIVGTTIFHIATKKVNLFSQQGEDLTFEDNSCVLILGLGKDIQISDYRLQITVYLGSYVCFKQKDIVYNFIIYII